MKKKSTVGAVLVTGGAKRVGKAIVIALAKKGFDIALHYHHSKTEALELMRVVKQQGVECALFSCDLGRQAQVSLLLEKVYHKFPHLNLLINNASIFEPSGFGKKGLEALDRHWQINFRSPFVLIGEFANLCSKGQIINILDTKISKNNTDYVGYLLSKKALAELTKMAAFQFAPHIRVNGISPGIILAPSGKGDEYLKKRASEIPLRMSGDVCYITHSVEFFIDNDFVTGQILSVDGGEQLI